MNEKTNIFTAIADNAGHFIALVLLIAAAFALTVEAFVLAFALVLVAFAAILLAAVLLTGKILAVESFGEFFLGSFAH